MARSIVEPARDRYVRRSGEDYIAPYLRLLPQGIAWPKETSNVLYKVVRGLAKIWGFVDGRAGDLLERESDPRKTIEILDWWERAWGLPDPCFPAATTIGERQRMLVLYMTWLGAQSRKYFTELMKWLGFTVTIKEYAPFMAGVSRVGETRPTKVVAGQPDQIVIDESANYRWYIGPPELRFYWSANVGTASVTWFRANSGEAGVDPHVRIGIPDDLQCLLNRWKPAHTDIVLDLSSLARGGPMQGTP